MSPTSLFSFPDWQQGEPSAGVRGSLNQRSCHRCCTRHQTLHSSGCRRADLWGNLCYTRVANKNCMRVCAVISFTQSCVSQSGDPRTIHACEQLNLFEDAHVRPKLSPFTNEPVHLWNVLNSRFLSLPQLSQSFIAAVAKYLNHIAVIWFKISNYNNQLSWWSKTIKILSFLLFISCGQQLYWSLWWLVRCLIDPQKFPTLWLPLFSPWQTEISIEVECVWVCLCVRVCACVHANCLKGGMAMGVAYCKSCIAFKWIHRLPQVPKVVHEPKDSWLCVWANRQKGGGL